LGGPCQVKGPGKTINFSSPKTNLLPRLFFPSGNYAKGYGTITGWQMALGANLSRIIRPKKKRLFLKFFSNFPFGPL